MTPKLPVGYSSPRWSAEVADCAVPMTFDQYSNCGFACKYCFSAFQRAVGAPKAAYLAREAKSVDYEFVERLFTDPDSFNPKAGSGQFTPYIKARRMMQWGGLSDPFCTLERRYGVGLKILRLLHDLKYPVTFSTKGTWWTQDPRYTELFKDNPHWHVKVSIITLDEAKARAVEVGVPTPEERLAAIERLAKLNVRAVTLRLRPFIIGITDPTHPELIRRAALAGAFSVSTEFFCYEQRSTALKTHMPALNEACGFDLQAFYKKYSTASGYLRLNRNVKRPFVNEMSAAAKAAGIHLFVSDAHFKERCPWGACCGIPQDLPWIHGQFNVALQHCKEHGSVRWADIAGDTGHLNFRYCSAQGFNTNSSERRGQFHWHTLQQYLRWLWNNPQAGQSPYTMFGGIMKPTANDEGGDLIYSYDPSKE